MKKALCLILAVVCVLSLAACSGQSREEERIERVVTRMLTCPDEKLAELILGTSIYSDGDPAPNPEKMAEQQRAHEAYAEHLKANVFTAEDFTEDYQAKFCGELYVLTNFPVLCIHAGATLSVESVEVELASENSRSYKYTAELVIERNGEKTPFVQTGKVQLSEDGRISWIDTNAFLALTTELQQLASAALAESRE